MQIKLITDSHCHSDYPERADKLRALLDSIDETTDLFIHLGDHVHDQVHDLDQLVQKYKQLPCPNIIIPGNHDFGQQAIDTWQALDCPDSCFHQNHGNWTFLFINSHDVSQYTNSQMEVPEEYREWNGTISSEQIKKIIEILDDSKENNVIIFSHHPVYPFETENFYNLWNDHEFVDIISSYKNVKAFINGHNHHGNDQFYKDIRFITVKGLVDMPIPQCFVMDFMDNSFTVRYEQMNG